MPRLVEIETRSPGDGVGPFEDVPDRIHVDAALVAQILLAWAAEDRLQSSQNVEDAVMMVAGCGISRTGMFRAFVLLGGFLAGCGISRTPFEPEPLADVIAANLPRVVRKAGDDEPVRRARGQANAESSVLRAVIRAGATDLPVDDDAVVSARATRRRVEAGHVGLRLRLACSRFRLYFRSRDKAAKLAQVIGATLCRQGRPFRLGSSAHEGSGLLQPPRVNRRDGRRLAGLRRRDQPVDQGVDVGKEIEPPSANDAGDLGPTDPCIVFPAGFVSSC